MQQTPSIPTATTAPIKFLRRREVESILGISKSSIYAKLDKKSPSYDPLFPQKTFLTPTTVRWVESEILMWAAARIAASRTSAF